MTPHPDQPDAGGLDLSGFTDAVPLRRTAQGAPARPGVYVIATGGCIPHIGTSGNLQNRIRTLAALGNHRGSAEVLCAAHCTQDAPTVRWRETSSAAEARVIESAFKQLGEPPQPREQFHSCVNGTALRSALVEAAGAASWEAGYIDALFEVGEQLHRLFAPRFHHLWEQVGWPPGPWTPSPATVSRSRPPER
jgi:hypothetical protein